MTTVYDIKIRYSLDDKVSSKLLGIAKNADKATDSFVKLRKAMASLKMPKTMGIPGMQSDMERASKSAFSLRDALMAVGAAGLVSKGKTALIGFNVEMDNLKNSMTTVMQMNMHMPFTDASKAANRLFLVFQEIARTSPGITSDFMHMAAAIAPAIAMAGGDQFKLQKITEGAVKAGSAFGITPSQMSMDIQEMMAGSVRLTSRTALQLIASQGIGHHEFNKLDIKDRAKMTEKILTDPRVLKGSEIASHMMAGEWSTISDTIQITLGKIGIPLMERFTDQFREINEWMTKHPKLIAQWVNTFSAGLGKAFDFFKNVAGFFVDNRDLLMGLVKGFAAYKVGQLGVSALGGLGSMASTMVGAVKSMQGGLMGAQSGMGVNGLFSILGTVGGAFGKLIPGLALFGAAITAATYLLSQDVKTKKEMRDMNIGFNEAVGDIPKLRADRKRMQALVETEAKRDDSALLGRYSSELQGIEQKLYDPETLGRALRAVSTEAVKFGGADLKRMSIGDMMSEQLGNRLIGFRFTGDKEADAKYLEMRSQVGEVIKAFQSSTEAMRNEILKYAFPDQFGNPTPKEAAPDPGKDWGGLSHAKVDVNIARVEVASEDPDRFVFDLVNIADNAIKHSTQSIHTIPGGF